MDIVSESKRAACYIRNASSDSICIESGKKRKIVDRYYWSAGVHDVFSGDPILLSSFDWYRVCNLFYLEKSKDNGRPYCAFLSGFGRVDFVSRLHSFN